MARIIALLIGLGLVVFIVYQTDLSEVWLGVLDLGAPGAAAVVGVYLAVFLIDTASWQLTLPSVRLTPRWLYRLWKVRMVGEALNLVVPAGSVGGEPVKAVLLKKFHGIGYHEGAASVIMDKTNNLLALLIFVSVGLTIMARREVDTRAAPARPHGGRGHAPLLACWVFSPCSAGARPAGSALGWRAGASAARSNVRLPISKRSTITSSGSMAGSRAASPARLSWGSATGRSGPWRST